MSVLVRGAPSSPENTAKQALRAAFPARNTASRRANTARSPLRLFQSLLRETPKPKNGASSEGSPEFPTLITAIPGNVAVFSRDHAAQKSCGASITRLKAASSQHNLCPRLHSAAFPSQDAAPTPHQTPPRRGNTARRALLAAFHGPLGGRGCYNPRLEAFSPQENEQTRRIRRLIPPSGAGSRHFQEIR